MTNRGPRRCVGDQGHVGGLLPWGLGVGCAESVTPRGGSVEPWPIAGPQRATNWGTHRSKGKVRVRGAFAARGTIPEKEKPPRRRPSGGRRGGWRRRTLPQSLLCSTIRAARLNGRVRDGNGCSPRAMTTSQSWAGCGSWRGASSARPRLAATYLSVRLTRPRPCVLPPPPRYAAPTVWAARQSAG
jgi:hypothetical protein